MPPTCGPTSSASKVHRTRCARPAIWLPARARIPWTVVAAGAAAIALVAVGYGFYPRQATLTDKDSIVLAEFTNTTGDAVFDGTLRHGLAVQLQQSPFLSLISDQRIRSTLPLMNQPVNAPLTPRRPGRVRPNRQRRRSARIHRGARQPVCPRPACHALHDRRRTRRRAGAGVAERGGPQHAQSDREPFPNADWESLATIEKHSLPSSEATTPSLEALKAYSAAAGEFVWPRRLPLLQRAVALDPEFAMAHAEIGFGLGIMGESALARQSR